MHRSPLVTLLAVGAGFAALLAVDMTQAADEPTATAQPTPSSATETPSATAPAAPTRPTTATSATPGAPTRTLVPSTLRPDSPSVTPPGTVPPGGVFPARIVYAGRTVDRGASVAIAVLNGRAAAYYCDGRAVEAWLTGTATADRVVLRSKTGAVLAARLADGRLNGSITLEGGKFAFTVGPAGPPAGLYRGQLAIKGRTTTIGWIVLPDGSQVGIRTTAGERGAAPPLDPRRPVVTIDGNRIPAHSVTGATTF